MALLKRKRSGLGDPMSVVTNFVNACNRHDAEGVSACLHPDFDSIQPMYPSRNFRGADQVRRNWQAIFDAEPGFRLTVLRSAAAGDTVWLELHGAGRDAEVAGVFVMGVQGDRIRWARIYSALVEDAPAVTDGASSEAPAPLRQVPPLADDAGWGEGATAASPPAPAAPLQEDLIAPVVDIDGNGRNRRGRGRRRREEPPAVPAGPEPALAEASGPLAAADPVVEEAAAVTPEPEDQPVGHEPADSIDPEGLIDPERLAEPESPEGDSEPVVGPDPVAGPSTLGVTGPDYDLEKTVTFTPMAPVPDAPGPDAPVPDAPGPDAPVPEAAAAAEPATDVLTPPAAPDPDVMVETMVEVDPRVVVEPEPQIDAEPEIFVEMSIPEGAVDPDPEVLVRIVVPEEAAEPDLEPPAPQSGAMAEPGLIVTTPPPAEDRAPDPPAGDQPKRKKRKAR